FTPTMRYVSNAKGDKVVISRSGEIIIADDNGRERERHKVPYGATLQVSDGDSVRAGKTLANWDPHHRPIITEYAGTVKFEHVEEGSTVAKQIDDVTGLSTLVVIDAKRRTTAASKGQRPSVKLINEAGEEVRIAGTDHAVNISYPVDPHDLLRLLGVEELARYIIDEVQDVYRLQGVKINDKHIEVIVRQMLRRIEIDEPGDTPFIQGEQVERAELLEENEKAEKEG